MRHRARHRAISAALSLIFVLSACSGDTDPTAGDDASPGTGEPVTTGDTTTTSEPATLAGVLGNAVATEADLLDQQAQIQEAIRVCMAEQGFDYQPIPSQENEFAAWSGEDHEERLRARGLGITTEVGTLAGSGGERPNPNEERLATMSDTERAAWEDALWGTEEERQHWMTQNVDMEAGTVSLDREPNPGCEGGAVEEVSGSSRRFDAELGAEWSAVRERIMADPRIIDAQRQWLACMAAAGYAGLPAERNDAWMKLEEDLLARLDTITGPSRGLVSPFGGWTDHEIDAFYEENTQEEIDAFIEKARQETMAGIDMEALAALQQDEIDMALADHECSNATSDIYNEVNAEYEAAFVADYRTVLEQFRDSDG